MLAVCLLLFSRQNPSSFEALKITWGFLFSFAVTASCRVTLNHGDRLAFGQKLGRIGGFPERVLFGSWALAGFWVFGSSKLGERENRKAAISESASSMASWNCGPGAFSFSWNQARWAEAARVKAFYRLLWYVNGADIGEILGTNHLVSFGIV